MSFHNDGTCVECRQPYGHCECASPKAPRVTNPWYIEQILALETERDQLKAELNSKQSIIETNLIIIAELRARIKADAEEFFAVKAERDAWEKTAKDETEILEWRKRVKMILTERDTLTKEIEIADTSWKRTLDAVVKERDALKAERDFIKTQWTLSERHRDAMAAQLAEQENAFRKCRDELTWAHAENSNALERIEELEAQLAVAKAESAKRLAENDRYYHACRTKYADLERKLAEAELRANSSIDLIFGQQERIKQLEHKLERSSKPTEIARSKE